MVSAAQLLLRIGRPFSELPTNQPEPLPFVRIRGSHRPVVDRFRFAEEPGATSRGASRVERFLIKDSDESRLIAAERPAPEGSSNRGASELLCRRKLKRQRYAAESQGPR